MTMSKRDEIMAFAEKQLAQNPTYNQVVYADDMLSHSIVQKPNTIEHELAVIAASHADDLIGNSNSAAIVEWLSAVLRGGHKGYENMTREELIEEIAALAMVNG